MSKKSDTSEEITLGKWLIKKCDTKDYRAGKVSGVKHPEVGKDLLESLTLKEVLSQAVKLEQEHLIHVNYSGVRTDIRKIDFPVDNMAKLCQREGVLEPRQDIVRKKAIVEQWKDAARDLWLKNYYDELLASLSQGNKLEGKVDENLFKCLNQLAVLKDGIWKRKFSEDVFGKSKDFEHYYEDKMLTVLRNYSPLYDEEMTKDEQLAVHGILTYSQTLEIKGNLVFSMESADEKEILLNTADWKLGSILNAQTLVASSPIAISGVKKIVTIENKANYESMYYSPDTLYIFTHGFFSPKERIFLKKISALAGEQVEFYHWSDMDFGGIRIFHNIKQEIFPKVKPLHMGRADYETALRQGYGYSIEKEKLEKLKKMEAGDLKELKDCILEHKMEIEQEGQLDEDY